MTRDIHADIETTAAVVLRQRGEGGHPKRTPRLSDEQELALIHFASWALPMVAAQFYELVEEEPKKGATI